MSKFSGYEYTKCREVIRSWHKNGVDWHLIRYLAIKEVCATQDNLLNQLDLRVMEGWPELDIDEWFELFEEARLQIEADEASAQDGWIGVTSGANETEKEVEKAVSGPNTCWSRYKYKLLTRAKFSEDTVSRLENECKWIVRHLKKNTQSVDSVKGMVVGNVQSGKTANMAGVIAMAADMGFNFFIVLSGLISNLRDQTAGRLYADLALLDGQADSQLNMHWQVLTNPNPKCQQEYRLSSLDLSEKKNGVTNQMRYMTVCLKIKKRLRDLLGWLQSQDALEKTGLLKVLIIDDECDQAGVNTANVESGEQTRIFQLIRGLCEHNRPGAKDTVTAGAPYLASNYVAYSATPYANILNDGDSKTSLFPRDFIASLPMSRSYWGPSRFFAGIEACEEDQFPEIPFVREITKDDLHVISGIHKNKFDSQIPKSLSDSVNWFLCCGAVRRFSGSTQPVSMLVHTSNKTCDHESVAKVIESYLESLSKGMSDDAESILSKLKKLYEYESERLNASNFSDMFPDYEPKDGEEISDVPTFDEIRPILSDILKQKTTHIKIADDDDQVKHNYGDGVHLCVDNSCNGAVISDDEGNGVTMRIKYPEAGQKLDVAPLFLVVGGNTLSRGLTLQGLVSSYFVRTVRQSDSLMQMGRWFGYRFGYELLPRVWMSSSTLAKFSLLNQIDLDLRRSLRDAMDSDMPPSQMMPCIQDTSSILSGFTLTSPRKMQMAEIAEEDFGGQHRVMSAYDIAESVLALNKQTALDFLGSLDEFHPAELQGSSNYYSPNVEWEKIKEFLSKYSVSNKGVDFQRLDLLFEFVENRLGGRKWTVVVAGNSVAGDSEKLEFAKGYEIGKIGRNINRKGDDHVSFKHVTAPADFVCDINYEDDCAEGTTPFAGKTGQSSVSYYRSHATKKGKDKTPLLIVNCISGKWINEKAGLQLPEDIIGVAMYIPSLKTGTVGSYTKLRVGNMTENDDAENESEV